MKLISVDIEADGPCPGLYSMIELGAVIVDRGVDKRYKGLATTFHRYIQLDTYQSHIKTLESMNWTREKLKARANQIHPRQAMIEFRDWIMEHTGGNAVFISDNNGFDWQFVNYYFHMFLEYNPFGHSSLNMQNLYKGACQNMSASFKGLRETRHTHNALDDAMGNAEAMVKIVDMFPALFRKVEL